MSTNGLTHTIVPVEGSLVEAPLIIQRVIICKLKKTLIAVYCKKNGAHMFTRTFSIDHRNHCSKYDDQIVNDLISKNNIFFNQDNVLKSIEIKLI